MTLTEIVSLCDENNYLLERLDKMELGAKHDKPGLRRTSETGSLKIEIRNLRMENIEKEVIRENEYNIEGI